MRLERAKNTKRNIVFGTVSKVVSLFFPFIIRTVIIQYLGVEYLGLNSLLGSILQVLSISDLGFSSAVVYSMYKPIAENDSETICALLNYYRKVYLIIGIVVMVIGACLCPFLPTLISGELPKGVNIYLIYIIYLVNSVIGYIFFGYKQSLLNAHQRIDVLNVVQLIVSSCMYICQIVILVFFRNYYFYLIILPITTLINNLINATVVDKMYPNYKCYGKIGHNEFGEIKKAIPGLFLNKICVISRNSFDSIFISAFLGLTVSAMYGNYYYIMSSVIAFLGIISASLLAGVGNSIVTETKEKNYEMMKKINFIYMWLAGWCAICLLCLYQPFMEIWVGKELCFSIDIVIMFVVYFYVLEMGVIRGTYSEAAGLWWQNRYRAILESIANLVLNFLLGKYFGIRGIIWATLISLFIINFLWGSQIVFKYYFENKKEIEYFKHHGKCAVVTCIVAVFTYFICYLIPSTGMLRFCSCFVVCAIVPNFLYFVIYRNTAEYKTTMPWLMEKIT